MNWKSFKPIFLSSILFSISNLIISVSEKYPLYNAKKQAYSKFYSSLLIIDFGYSIYSEYPSNSLSELPVFAK